MIRRIDWRTLKGRARGNRAPAQPYLTHQLFSNVAGRGRGFRARNRARQSILLIVEMIFDYLIAIVSLKAAEIGMSEVTKKKMDDFAPPISPEDGR